MPGLIIPFPTELRPRLPTIVGNVDYLTLRLRLQQSDELLRTRGVAKEFVEEALKGWMGSESKTPSARQQQKFQLRSRQALRGTVLRTLLQEEYRGFSCQLAGNRLLQSGLEQSRKLHLKEAVDLEAYFLDTPCLKANIHFPVDWVLWRDGVRTLLKATILIRKQGLKGRMEPPEAFLRRINRRSMEKTPQRRQRESKRGRQRVLRPMKKVVKIYHVPRGCAGQGRG
mgnify:CR=1 FL=1